MTLVCIGSPDGQEGAGRVKSDDANWLQYFRSLARLAKTIIVVPGKQPGIVAEMVWLRRTGLLASKTICFKPHRYHKADWEDMREELAQNEGFDLPEYSPKQFAFKLYSSGRHHGQVIWGWIWWLQEKKYERGRRH